MSKDEAENLELGRALGKAPDDPSRVEVFPVSNLEGLGLAGYLIEGCGVAESQIAPDRSRLGPSPAAAGMGPGCIKMKILRRAVERAARDGGASAEGGGAPASKKARTKEKQQHTS